MLGARPYPAVVRKLLAQTVAAMPLLAAHTKLEGRISLQFQHDEGAVQLLIAQVEHGRGGSPETGLLVRGMAKANADAPGGRKSGGAGKSVSVRVELGGRRIK